MNSKKNLERFNSILLQRFLFEEKYFDIYIASEVIDDKIVIFVSRNNKDFEKIVYEILEGLNYEINIGEFYG